MKMSVYSMGTYVRELLLCAKFLPIREVPNNFDDR